MEFSFSNLGIVKKADIDLNGISVITGLNDTGKSFLSKGIYSIIKTLNESEIAVNQKRIANIAGLLQQINFNHRQVVPFTQEKITAFNITPIRSRVSDLLLNKGGNKSDVISIIDDYVSKVFDDLDKHVPASAAKATGTRKSVISQLKTSIIANLSELSSADKFEAYFNEEIIQKMFQGQLNNLDNEGSSTEIQVKDGATEVLNFTVTQNKTKISTEYAPISTIFRDALIIETPIIANLERYITYTLAYVAQGDLGVQLPNHYVDLTRKLNVASSNAPNLYQEILTNIKRIIGGEVKFLPDQGGVVFVKANGATIRVNNMATGIKSFGLLQILLTSGVINPSSLLIIDEPEVHLHPKWEVEYAKLLVLLSKAGVQIIISSHSPYLIEAISKLSKDSKTPAIFYYGEVKSGETNSEFTNATGDLNVIFKKLAEPMRELFLS